MLGINVFIVEIDNKVFVSPQRTQRVPKVARHPNNPEEFAKILIEKLEKVKLERELNEREAHNLSAHHEVSCLLCPSTSSVRPVFSWAKEEFHTKKT